jgi:hypothetical protein
MQPITGYKLHIISEYQFYINTIKYNIFFSFTIIII